MIEILGIKRVFVLAVLAAAISLMVAGDIYVLEPKSKKLDRDIRVTESQVSSRQTELTKLIVELEELEKQKDSFESLKRVGFFNEQNRVIARERFEKMQRASGVLSAKYTIAPAIIEKDGSPQQNSGVGLEEDKYVVLNSPMSVKLEAVDDIDVYSFLYYINYAFPGHTKIKSLKISRTKNITQAILDSIGGGNPEVLIESSFEIDWRTLVDKTHLEGGGDL